MCIKTNTNENKYQFEQYGRAVRKTLRKIMYIEKRMKHTENNYILRDKHEALRCGGRKNNYTEENNIPKGQTRSVVGKG